MVKLKISLGFLLLILAGAGWGAAVSLLTDSMAVAGQVGSAVCCLGGLCLLISVELKIERLINSRKRRAMDRK